MDYEKEKAFNSILTLLLNEDPNALKKAYVEAVTEHDPDLRDLVHTYLGDHAGSLEVGFLLRQSMAKVLHTRSVNASNTIEAYTSSDIALGTQVGNYSIESVLGEGGMGTVYLGRHHWEGVPAAIKIVRLTNTDAIGQFARERCILARLNHPNIAHFLDSGVLADGRSWLALEYVDGMPLSDYCQIHQPNLETRIRLFIELCQAMAHVHEQGILHCDIKPRNIMVTARGHIKLLDFGIARDLSSERRVVCEQPLMTPEYASPEQVSHDELTPASDVYSLGVLLYQLLTGKRPYRFEKYDPKHIIDVIHNVVISLPSRSGGKTLETTRALRGDLDTIILKALDKRAKDRYQNAGELLADLMRYQAGQPVSAHRSSWVYVSRKFFKRNLWSSCLVAACMLVSLVSLGLAGFHPCNHDHEHGPVVARQERLLDETDEPSDLIANQDPWQSELQVASNTPPAQR